MKENKQASEACEWMESIAFALAFTMLILVFVFNFSRVSGTSMVPTLEDGDRVLVRTAFYTPHRGDIITTDALIDYGKPLAKRVIALSGDIVDIDAVSGTVFVNGESIDEPYIVTPTTQNDLTFPYTVPDGLVFVMGDNRPGSMDSRSARIGCIDARDILGEIIFRVAPTSNMGKVK